jgi:MFS transporter, Spinster family, sphingosine-1-phosphate transporter
VGPKGALAVLTLLNLVNYLDRFILPAVLPTVTTELKLTQGQAGVFGSAFIVVYMLASPVFGRLGDVGSRRMLIAVGILAWSLASAAGGLAIGFVTLLIARAGVGVGEAAYATIAPSLISDLYPPRRRQKALSLFFIAIPVGSALGFILGGLLGATVGWRWAFFLTGLPGVLLAGLALLLPDPPRGGLDGVVTPKRPPPLGVVLGDLIKNREYMWTVAGYTACTFAVGGLAYWMPTYLNKVRGIDLALGNTIFGGLTVVGGIAGTLGGSWLADHLRGRVRHPYLLVSALSSMACAPFAIAAFFVPTGPAVYGLMFCALVLLFVSTGPINTIVVSSVAPEIRAMAQAVCIFTIHILGDALSPWIIGAVADRVGLRMSILLVPATILAGGLMWLYAQRTVKERPALAGEV